VIDIGIDKNGSSLRLLIAQALRLYPTSSLYSFLEDRSVPVRSAAAREIQIRGEIESFKHVVQLANDRRPYVREIAIFILGQLGTPAYPYKADSVDLIAAKLAQDPSSAVRAAAAAALGHLKAYPALDGLVAAAVDDSVAVRACVAAALLSMKRSSKARNALRALKNDASDEVRRWATEE
jgi:HEAT repeat protein